MQVINGTEQIDNLKIIFRRDALQNNLSNFWGIKRDGGSLNSQGEAI